MKKTALLLGILFLAVNLLIGFFIASVGRNALIVSSLVLVTTFLLLYLTGAVEMKDGFKASLPFLFIFSGIVEYILSFFIHDGAVKGNGFLLAIVILFVIQVFIFIICAGRGK